MTTKTAGGRKPSAYDRWTARTAQAIEQLLAGDQLPLASPIKPGVPGRPYNGATGRWYAGGNLFALHIFALIEGHAEHRWLTYRQAASVGAQVRKGERGTPIVVWRPARRKPDFDTEEEEERRGYFGGATVFNASQIDGLPDPDLGFEAADLSAAHSAADAFIRATGADLRISEVARGGELGSYDFGSDYLTLRPREHFVNNAEYYSVVFHELAHWTGHQARLGRPLTGDRHCTAYAREELIAEMTAYTLATTFGLGFEPPRKARYLDHYSLLAGDPKAYTQVAGASSQVCRFLCELADPDGQLLPRTASPPLPTVAPDAEADQE